MPMTVEERKEARRASNRKYAEANREKIRAKNRAYAAENKDKQLAWRQANPELVKKYAREYQRRVYAANPERMRKIAREYRKANLKKCRARAKEWKQNNPERTLTLIQQYRQTHRDELLNYNIKRHLAEDLNCAIDEIPHEFFEVKKAIIEVKRKVKEMTK
jgi:hypothetical protein